MAKTKTPPGGRRFPCEQCGALVTFVPGSNDLACEYCGHRTLIERAAGLIIEYDLREALQWLSTVKPAEQRAATQCESCAASFNFDHHVHSGECPFCGTPIVLGTGTDKHIKPKSLLPFLLTEQEAQQSFRRWIGRLWFAPTKVKKYARGESRLTGVYVPFWTYDSQTHTGYVGERGDMYTVPQTYTTIENGRAVRRTRMVTKIRWTPVRGRVARFFDDILIGASRSLPRRITDSLRPWDLQNLTPYNEKYLSGFQAEIYQVEVDQGFDMAVEVMDSMIRNDIARDIGGDQQRIHNVDTRHSSTTFKHLLLPVWSAGFTFRDKTYRFVVNGRTGKVQGERPYSFWKIAGAAIAALIAVVILVAFAEESGLLDTLVSTLGHSF
ncbi:MAG: primosomal protein N' (replication factor Y) - superfamily II helicase [Gammaproteobacteria bacterium]|nr:primosomal protein N' (replication factor Y) - superfamily II helicase [Gammaproteobacteria bacterium]